MGTHRSYFIGFALSLALTFAAYFAVTEQLLESRTLVALILVLAFAQFAVQMFFFLHLGQESGPRWNLSAFMATVGLVFIVLASSLWIMNHLNYNMLPSEMEDYLIKDEGYLR